MGKYVKPTFEFVKLRPEERFLRCEKNTGQCNADKKPSSGNQLGIS
jgi:hypothetical protein